MIPIMNGTEWMVLNIYDNLWFVLAIFIFIWLYGWAKSNLGSTIIALVFAILISYLTFYTEPGLIWVIAALFLFATFGKEIFEKVNVLKKQ